MGKTRFNVQNLIGKEFGSVYQVNNKTKCLDHVEKFNELFNFKNSIDELVEEEGKRDNRSIVDDNRSQKLTPNEINRIRDNGMTTKQIIERLVENSSTFNQKTIYSQEKYLKKKQEKYSNYIRIYKPNTTLLCDMWFNQGASKTGYIRIDSLAKMLNLCNLRSGSKYLVVDNFFGLLSAAVLERLIGDGTIFDLLNNKNDESKSKLNGIQNAGKCVQIILGDGPNNTWREAIYALNFKEEHLNECLFSVQIHKTIPLLKGELDQASSNKSENTNEILNQSNELNQETNLKVETNLDQNLNEPSDQTANNELIDELEDEFRKNKRFKIEKKLLRKKKRIVEEKIALELLSEKNFNGLLLASRNYDLIELTNHLLNFLAPSSQIVIFSEHLQPLTECYNELKDKLCNCKLSEIWMRNYQIMPMRTRPEMEMFGKSGYILNGVKLSLD